MFKVQLYFLLTNNSRSLTYVALGFNTGDQRTTGVHCISYGSVGPGRIIGSFGILVAFLSLLGRDMGQE